MSHLRTWSKIRTVDLVWLGLWGGVAWQAQVLLCLRLEADLPIGTEAVDGGCVLGMRKHKLEPGFFQRCGHLCVRSTQLILVLRSSFLMNH